MVLSSALPESIRTIFDSIEGEVIWLHGKWIIYRQLYGTSKERIDLLNNSASTFFRIVHDVLLNDVVLALSRLTDPDKSLGKDNRSLEKLIDQLEEEGKYPELVKSLQGKLAVLKTQCKPFRKWRNRKIAHSDLLTALSLHPDPLPGISRSLIEQALKIVREFINEYATYFGANYTGYEHFCMTADAETLVSLLEQFWKYREAELKSWAELANRPTTQYGG